MKSAHFDGRSFLWADMALTGPSLPEGRLRYDGFRHFTIEAWLYPIAGGSQTGTIFGFTGPVGTGFAITIKDHVLSIISTAQFIGTQLVPQTYSQKNWNIPDNQWTHVAIAFQLQIAPQLSIYLNGVLAGTITTTSSFLFEGVDSVIIGAQATGSLASDASATHSFFCGDMHDFKIWSTTRSASQIPGDMSDAAIDVAASPDLLSSLWAYWPMSSISNNYINDASGNSNTAAIVGNIMIQDPKNMTPTDSGTSSGSTGSDGKNPDQTLANISTLSDVARGMQHVVNATQEVLEQHYIRMLDRFLEPDGSARTMSVKLKGPYRLDVPLITLLNPPSLALDEMQVQMSVRIDSESVKTFPPPAGASGTMSRSSFMVTMAPMPDASGTAGPESHRPSNIIDITMKFKAGDRPEGVTRIINEFVAMMIPTTTQPEESAKQPSLPATPVP